MLALSLCTLAHCCHACLLQACTLTRVCFFSALELQTLKWEARDVNEACTIDIYGRTANGRTVCVQTPFSPFFYVSVPGFFCTKKLAILWVLTEAEWRHEGDLMVDCEVVDKVPFVGFTNKQPVELIKVSAKSIKTYRAVVYR